MMDLRLTDDFMKGFACGVLHERRIPVCKDGKLTEEANGFMEGAMDALKVFKYIMEKKACTAQ